MRLLHSFALSGLSFFIILFIPFVSATSNRNESAWNGQFTSMSTPKQFFTPYYVPPGAKSYDSSSPLVMYTGSWTESFSVNYVQKSLRSTTQINASVQFTFTGTGIEWFGNTDKRHGIANVFIDGRLVQQVDAWSDRDKPLRQQRLFFKFDLPSGSHSIKIVNAEGPLGSLIDVDAFIVTRSPNPDLYNTPVTRAEIKSKIFLSDENLSKQKTAATPRWTLTEKGITGVHAMQLAIISSTHALIVDKVEHNPLTISGHPAWAALYNLEDHSVTPLDMKSNSFCAGGTFLGNGTMINVGGNPVVETQTSPADFGDLDGLQAIRIFEPCDSTNAEGCNMYENHARIRMASPRWYNTVLRISDGSAMIIGGAKKGGWINNQTVNNPTIEYFPPKDIHGSTGMPLGMPFLADTLNSNLFPIAFALPDGRIFIAANQDAMIYDWKANTEHRLPKIPNGVRVTYPMTGTGLLLPLSPDNNYTPEVLLCGGSTIDDRKAGYDISSQASASAQCSRMVLTDTGIAAGWQVEQMPEARVMPDAVLLPTGQVVIVNGAATGISGYGNVLNQVGSSNADNPVLTPVLYDPRAVIGNRFSSAGMPTSRIPRLYHSVATLSPAGDVMIAGSNPNLDRSEIKYPTEYRVEWLRPSYMNMERPEIVKTPLKLGFGTTIDVQIKLPSGNTSEIKAILMDLGYITHAVHANTRMVILKTSRTGDSLKVQGPPNGNVYPPGPGWLYIVAGDIPSSGVKVMVGNGSGPPVNADALKNLLKNSAVD